MQKTKEVKQDISNLITTDTILFFDMDGTLIDTDFANFLAYKKAINSVTKSGYNLKYNSDKRFNRSTLKSIIPTLTEKEQKKIIQEKEEYYNEFIHKTKLNTEVSDILFQYSKTNKTVLVTNSRKDRAITTLKHFGLENKFNYIIYREFDKNNKMMNKFENAISKLNISPSLIIAFENEETEIQDAKRAGIESIIKIKLI